MQGVLDFSSAVRGTLPLPFPFPFSLLSPFPFGPPLGSAANAGADLSPLSVTAFGGMALAGAPLILGGGGFCSLRYSLISTRLQWIRRFGLHVPQPKILEDNPKDTQNLFYGSRLRIS